MADLPASVGYMTVTGRLVLGYADSNDAGSRPDIAPGVGTVTFSPDIKTSFPLVAIPDALMIAAAPIKCALDGNGNIVPPLDGSDADPSGTATPGVNIIAPLQPGILSDTDWTWTATFTPAAGQKWKGFSRTFTGAPGDTLNIATLVPVPANPGTDLVLWQAAVAQTAANRDAVENAVATLPTHGETTSSLNAALPNVLKAIRTYDDSNPRTLRQVDLGSSVGLGPGGTLDTVNSVGSHLFAKLSPILNRTGALHLEHTNASVGGSTITAGQQTDYDTAKTTAGGPPTLVPLIYGMNDGRSPQYHQGQTLPGVYANGRYLIQAIQGDGADAIIFTTPHPHTGRTPWGDATGSIYPAGGMVPDGTVAQSIVNVTSRSGATVPASYRHLRVNESLRQLGADLGVPVIDVEAYWFVAVAEHGEDALFGAGEYVHPNLLGFQRSYHAAIDDFVRGFSATTAAAPAPARREILVRKQQNTARANTTGRAADPELGFPVAPGEVWMFEAQVHYTTPLAADIRLGFTFPAGITGRFAVRGVEPTCDATSGFWDKSASGPIFDWNYHAVGGNNQDAIATVTGTIVVADTGGTFWIDWAQDHADAGDTIVFANSSLRATRIG